MSTDQRLARVFIELADTLVDEFDPLDFLHLLTERSVELLNADAAGVIISDRRGQLQVVAATDHQAHVLELFELQTAEGPCVDCFNTGRAVVNVDLGTVAERWPRFSEASTAAGYRSAHALPLRLRDRVIGAMNLFCIDRSTLSDDDLELGQALADVATIGLLQEQAVRQQEVLAEQLQAALDSRILIEQAKGALAERAGLSIDDAFQVLRQHSRRASRPLRDVAADVIAGRLTEVELRRG